MSRQNEAMRFNLLRPGNEISAACPFESRYVDVLGSRIHYVDQGDGDPILFLHGNPTSSYLWRNVIPHVVPHARAIAPDLIGMGRSDKPDLAYRFFDHVPYIDGFIEALDLRDLTLVLHDWGSALGLHYAKRHEENVRSLVLMEAILRPWSWAEFPAGWKTVFKLFRTRGPGELIIVGLNGFVRGVLPKATVRKLTRDEMRRYAEPFGSWKSRRPILQWPREIPIDGEPADVHEAVEAYARWLEETAVPKLLLHARPGGIIDAEEVQRAKESFPNLTTVDIGPGIHYVQEDNPHGIGTALVEWLGLGSSRRPRAEQPTTMRAEQPTTRHGPATDHDTS
jgi:haloalkane dehalogenase